MLHFAKCAEFVVFNLNLGSTREMPRKHIHQVSAGSLWPLIKHIAQHEARKFRSPCLEFPLDRKSVV